MLLIFEKRIVILLWLYLYSVYVALNLFYSFHISCDKLFRDDECCRTVMVIHWLCL